MNDLEQHEMELLRMEEQMEYQDSLVTPAVMQIMDHRNGGDIFSVDNNKVTVVGVEICVHAGDRSKYFVSVTAKFPEYQDTGDEWRGAYLNCVHRKQGHDGMPMRKCRKFASQLIMSNDYLDKDDWIFNT